MRLLSALLLIGSLGFSTPAFAVSLDGFSDQEKETRLSIMQSLNPFVDQRKKMGPPR